MQQAALPTILDLYNAIKQVQNDVQDVRQTMTFEITSVKRMMVSKIANLRQFFTHALRL